MNADSSEDHPNGINARCSLSRPGWAIGLGVALNLFPVPEFPGSSVLKGLLDLAGLGLIILGTVKIVRTKRVPARQLDTAAQIARAERRMRASIGLFIGAAIVTSVCAWDIFWFVPDFCERENTCIPVEVVLTYPGLVLGVVVMVWAPIRWLLACQELARLKAM